MERDSNFRKEFHLEFLKHANTESIFKIGFSVARMTSHSVEPSRAAQSSSLGTEMVLIGATRVLEKSMCEWKPSEFFETMYATLAYADSEASQKMCSSAASKFSQRMRRGIFRIIKSQRDQPRFFKDSGCKSSQPSFRHQDS